MMESAETVFPEPDSPTIPSVSPVRTEKLMLFTAVISVSLVKKRVVRLRMSIKCCTKKGKCEDKKRKQEAMSSEKRVVNRGACTIVLSELVLDKSIRAKLVPGLHREAQRLGRKENLQELKLKTFVSFHDCSDGADVFFAVAGDAFEIFLFPVYFPNLTAIDIVFGSRNAQSCGK